MPNIDVYGTRLKHVSYSSGWCMHVSEVPLPSVIIILPSISLVLPSISLSFISISKPLNLLLELVVGLAAAGSMLAVSTVQHAEEVQRVSSQMRKRQEEERGPSTVHLFCRNLKVVNYKL